MKTKAIHLMGLFLELEKWALKTLNGIPASAPVALQIVESIFAVRDNVLAERAIRRSNQLTSKAKIANSPRLPVRDELAAFIACVEGRFTSQAQPFARLIRKGLIEVRADGSMTAK